MRRRTRIARAGVLAGLVALLPAGPALAQVVEGSEYIVLGQNVPDDWGPETVTFDGVAELVNGGLISVNERQAAVPGGVWVEVSIETTGGSPIAGGGTALNKEFLADRIQAQGPGMYGAVIGSWFAYFTTNGVLTPLPGPPNGELRPHPFDPAIGQAWFSDNFSGVPQVYARWWSNILTGGFIAPPAGATGIHVGVLFEDVPDPLPVGFDLELLDLEVTGQGAFQDDFEDGVRDAGPTTQLRDLQGSTSESGGALRFADADGAGASHWDSRRDLVVLERSFRDGLGDAEIRATVRAPGQESYWQALSLVLDGLDVPWVFSIEWNSADAGFETPCGSGLQATLRTGARPMRGGVIACDSIDAAAGGSEIGVRLTIDDAPNTVLFSYSLDGGMSFTDMTAFDVPLAQGSVSLFGFGHHGTSRLLIAGAGTALIEDLDGDGADFDRCPEDFDGNQPDLPPIDGLAGITDRDGDGRGDVCDPCPGFGRSDGMDLDTDGNGIGDLCECGDQNGDHTVNVLDILAINAAIFGAQPVRPLCDATNDTGCNINDILAVNAKIFGAEAFCGRYPPPAP